MLEISSDLMDRIVAETMLHPRMEACGLLFGDPDRVRSFLPCRNVAADPTRFFEIDPAALLAAHRQARTGGPAVIGCYHSHPGGPAMPSPRDAAAAAPDGSIWLVLAGRAVTAWRAVEDGVLHGRFRPLALAPACRKRDERPDTGADNRDMP